MAFEWFEFFSKENRLARQAKRRQWWHQLLVNIDNFFNPVPPPPEARGKRDDGYQIIGINNLELRHNTTENTIAALLTHTTAFHTAGDWETDRADSARIELVNNTGSSQTVKEVLLIGKLVLRNSGMYYHDKFSDWADIERNGEKVISCQSDDLINNAHTSNMATYLWKSTRKKHFYAVEVKGTADYFHPGAWGTFAIGGAGQSENIDSKVRIESVATSKRPGSLGSTYMLLAEVEENFKYNSSYKARTIANAMPWRNPQGTSVMFVAAGTGTEIAHIYCEGSADQVGIQAAIDAASGNGGGIVHLGVGTFYLTAAIEMKSNVTLEGEGPSSTILEKNANDYAISCNGGSGTELTNIAIKNMKITRNSADANVIDLVWMDYSDDCLLEDLVIDDSKKYCLYANNCDDLILTRVKVIDFVASGFYVILGTNTKCTDCSVNNSGITLATGSNHEAALFSGSDIIVDGMTIKNISGSTTGFIVGLYVSTPNKAHISNCTVKDVTNTNAGGAAEAYGIETSSSANNVNINNATVDNIDNTATAAQSYGISIRGDDSPLSGLFVTGCSGTGVLIQASADATQIHTARSTGNGTNFTDSGTNTTADIEVS